jgi:hypothetical protein
MSYLRQIMQRLHAATAAPAPANPAEAAAPPHTAGPAATDPLLGLHSQQYAERLQACSDAMLRYEQAWLEQHSEALQLCRVQPEMLQVAGGERHLQQMVSETERFAQLLEAEISRRGLVADPHRHTVVASEHAWELSHPATRRAWGIWA